MRELSRRISSLTIFPRSFDLVLYRYMATAMITSQSKADQAAESAASH